MKSVLKTAVCILPIWLCVVCAHGQTYTGLFRTLTANTDYHQFIRNGTGAAVYINQENTTHPILRLSSGTTVANGGVVFTVENDGSVGIGTNAPKAKLAVNGNILATEIKIKTDISVPDYVFEPDYDLPTLSEVEAHIQQHKHLPEIPSAADIQRDGLDLAQMNLLLLKKVEELTLHVIALKKELDDQKALIKAVNQQPDNPVTEAR